jgi:hypothetical protein
MNDPAASSGVSSSLLVRHSVLDTESSRVFWIPAFAGMTNSPQAAGNTTRRDSRGTLNPKSEARSTKQIQISNVLMFKTEQDKSAFGFSFGSFEFWSLSIVSDFEFRASNWVAGDALHQGLKRAIPAMVLLISRLEATTPWCMANRCSLSTLYSLL